MKNKNTNDIGNLDVLIADNVRLRARILDLETYIDGRKTQWAALTQRLSDERQTIEALGTAIRVRDARMTGFARTTARLERRATGQRREIELLRDRLTQIRRSNPEQPEAAAAHSAAEARVMLRVAYDKLTSMRTEQNRLKDAVADKNVYIDRLSGKLSVLELEHSETVKMLHKQNLIIDHIEAEIRGRLARVASGSHKPQQRQAIAAAIRKLDKQHSRLRAKLDLEFVNTMGRLTLLSDTSESVEYEIGPKALTIGRGPNNDIRIRRQSVSREHARLTPLSDGMLLEDLTSRNGVHINDRRVSSGRLHSGDIVTIGKARFRYTTSVIPFNRHRAS